MKKGWGVIALMILGAGLVVAEPVVDGKVSANEYANTVSVLRGKGTLNWSQDAKGGLNVALTVKTAGWVGLGFGASTMAGAYIYMGFQEGAKAVFSEQVGKGHRHSDSGKVTADASKVVVSGGQTTMEFHLPVDKLPFTGKSVAFITAYGSSADLVSFHEDYDTGKLALK